MTLYWGEFNCCQFCDRVDFWCWMLKQPQSTGRMPTFWCSNSLINNNIRIGNAFNACRWIATKVFLVRKKNMMHSSIEPQTGCLCLFTGTNGNATNCYREWEKKPCVFRRCRLFEPFESKISTCFALRYFRWCSHCDLNRKFE